MVLRTSWVALASLGLVVIAVACSSNSSPTFDGFDGGDDGSGGSSGGSSGGGDDAPSFGDDSVNPTCNVHCSADLHQVIDCNNQVKMTCPPTQGCGAGGQCVAACDAAKANQSTIGCDYYSVDPGTDGEANGSCFAAYIANTWTSPVTITLEYAGKTLDAAPYSFIPTGQGASITYAPLPNGQLPPNQLAIVFLADATAVTGPSLPTPCPASVQAYFKTAEASSQQTGIINAFHLTTSAPVVAYDIFPYGGSTSYISSATLLLPSSAWDTNYLPIDAWVTPNNGNGSMQPFIEVAAATDATHVTILPKVAIVGGTG
ncbi:MAG TPA: hypothetical protein VIF15_14810, partial [Polyangiaceae bacterium]